VKHPSRGSRHQPGRADVAGSLSKGLAMLTPGYARYLAVSLTAFVGAFAAVPSGWFEGR